MYESIILWGGCFIFMYVRLLRMNVFIQTWIQYQRTSCLPGIFRYRHLQPFFLHKCFNGFLDFNWKLQIFQITMEHTFVKVTEWFMCDNPSRDGYNLLAISFKNISLIRHRRSLYGFTFSVGLSVCLPLCVQQISRTAGSSQMRFALKDAPSILVLQGGFLFLNLIVNNPN